VLVLGPPGVCKTHLAIAQANSCYFVSLVDLIEMIHRDAKEDRLGHRLATFCRPRLLVLDKLGRFSLDRQAAQFLFQPVSRRYREASIILTSSRYCG
jgi:DNA replication protein DnaC